MHVDELELLIQNAQALSQFYLLNQTVENGVRFEESIAKLVYVIASLDPTARLSVAAVSEFLLQCKQILTCAEASHSMRSRLCLLFSNFALYNVDIRRFLCGEAQLCNPVFRCLQALVDAQLGPQNVIDVLRLLQLLTYERCLSLGSWTNEALGFIVAEVLKVDGATTIETSRRDAMDHPLPYCLTILCNLVARSRLVAARVKKMGSFKQLCRRLLDFLQNNSRTVVVCSLVLIGHLDERTRDTIFSPQNIAQSFLCIFNVLGCADSLMTTHIAVDLLKRLIVATPIYGPYTLTTTAKNFTSYQFFEKSMQRTAVLLTSVDPRSEEAEAVFDLLLSLCRVNDLRPAICAAIIRPATVTPQPPTGERRPLSAPLVAMARIAAVGCADAVRPLLPLHALRMLTFLIREAIEEGVKVGDLISSRALCKLVESSVKSVIETKSVLVKYQCMRITEGLRLAEAVVNDEDARQDLLDVVNAPLCAHINESQLISNPIVGFVNKLRSGTSTTTRVLSSELPEWSLSGAAIPLQLLRLLATLKDYSKMHKDLYWRSLKDERIVPFIAFAIAQGDDELVYDAFVLFTHCAQVPELPIRYLSDLVATCTMELRVAARRDDAMSRSSSSLLQHQNGMSCESLSDYAAFADVAAVNGHESFRQLDELLEKMKSGMDLEDVRTSQLVCAFEKKVAMHVSRERELEQLISMKEQALSQSERLRNICQNRGDGEEIQNLRIILGDLEKKLVDMNGQITASEAEKQEQLAKVAKLKKVLELERAQRAAEVEQFQRDRVLLLDENEKERELQSALRQRFDEMTTKFDIASKATIEKQRELELSADAIRECQKRQSQTEQQLADTVQQLTASRSMAQTQSEELDRRKAEIARLVEENKKLQKIKLAMAQMLSD